MARRERWSVALVLLAGCADEAPSDDVDGVDDTTRGPVALDLDACGATCGDGPVYLIDAIDVARPEGDVLPGFDLDGVDEDCGTVDGVGPAGEPGVDNRLGTLLPAMPATVTSSLPDVLATLISSGQLMLLAEVVGPADLADDGPAGLVLRRGDGLVTVGGDDRVLEGQTVGLAADAVLGATDAAAVHGGVLDAGPFDLRLRFQALDLAADLPLLRGRVRLQDDGAGGVDVLIGGVIPFAPVRDLLADSSDAIVAGVIPPVLELAVDARSTPGGDCDAITGAFVGHAVPVFVFDDPPAP